MDWEIDDNGFVRPYTCIPISIAHFQKRFVADVAIERRVKIFEQYSELVCSLKKIIVEPFYQWINGSFINIYSFPNDLDIVTFLPNHLFKIYNKNLMEICQDKERFSFLDLYMVKVFESDHKDFFLYKSDRLYWHHLFSYSKRDVVSGKRFEKGFFQINFDT